MSELKIYTAKRRPSLTEIDPPATKRTADNTNDPSGSICARCNSIPWSEIAQRRPILPKGQIVVPLLPESHQQLLQSNCEVHICGLLALLKPPSLDATSCSLNLYSSRRIFSKSTDTWRGCAVMGVVPSGKSYTACQVGSSRLCRRP